MPYNSETETFYQSPATVVDSTPDGDTVQEGFDDRLTPAMTGVYADFNLLKAYGMISVGIPATTTARGIGRVATSDDLVDGATITNGPAFLAAGSDAVTTTPTAHAVPQADANGKLDGGWIPSDSAKLNVGMDNADLSQVNPVLSYNRYETNSAITISNAIALGTGTPNNTDGTQVMALTVVPKKVGSILIIRAHVVLGSSASTTHGCAAIFKNSDTHAIAVSPMYVGSNAVVSVDVGTKIKTTSTDPIAIKIRAGTNQTTAYLNGYSTYSPVYGVSTSYLEVTEYAA